jgi:hypothetical protein
MPVRKGPNVLRYRLFRTQSCPIPRATCRDSLTIVGKRCHAGLQPGTAAGAQPGRCLALAAAASEEPAARNAR